MINLTANNRDNTNPNKCDEKIYFAETQFFIKQSKLKKSKNLPNFDFSQIFLLETLGEGGFGIVKKAYDKSQNEFVALKQLSKKILQKNEEEALNNIILEDILLNEVEKVRASQFKYNQYFLKYYGVFKDANKESPIILKMENGLATLEDLLKAGKTFTCEELLYVIGKISEGFAILEENGITNRDVKAENIILVEDPSDEERFFYKISDFGIGCKLVALKMIKA